MTRTTHDDHITVKIDSKLDGLTAEQQHKIIELLDATARDLAKLFATSLPKPEGGIEPEDGDDGDAKWSITLTGSQTTTGVTTVGGSVGVTF